MKSMTVGMMLGGMIGGVLTAAALADFNPQCMQRQTNRMIRRTKKRINRSMHAMGMR